MISGKLKLNGLCHKGEIHRFFFQATEAIRNIFWRQVAEDED